MTNKIVFCLPTPPFEHGKSEREYLDYEDWFSQLRRAIAATGEVKFVSLTKKKTVESFYYDGYEAIFFPVDNLDSGRQHEGRLRYRSHQLIDWLKSYKPNHVHVVGTGADLSNDVLQASSDHSVRYLWERCTVTDRMSSWPEIRNCDYYLHATEESISRAKKFVAEKHLILVPLGAGNSKFTPESPINKMYDIITIGRITSAKNYGGLKEIIHKNGFSWIHLGGYFKGKPFSTFSDYWYSRKMRSLGIAGGLKYSKDRNYATGILPHSDIPKYINKARIMVHPSKHEGAARSVQEALLCGLPVIVDKRAVPWVKPEFSKSMTSEDQLEALIIEYLSLRDDELLRLGMLGREWLLKNHGIEVLARVITNLHGKVPLT